MYDTFVYEQVFPSFQVVHFSHIGHIVTLNKVGFIYRRRKNWSYFPTSFPQTSFAIEFSSRVKRP